MGQKVHPIGFRLGINKVWSSRWYPTSQSYADNLAEDIRIRQYIKKRFANAFVADVEIERAGGSLKINIHSSRPSMIIGKKGSVAEALKGEILTKCKVKSGVPSINVFDVKKPDLNAQLVADNIKNQLERRVSFRRAMKKVISQTIKNGAKGIKVNCAGRLGGAEMARKERYMEGRVPLHTLRADVDYARAEAHTTYGIIGIKVWIYRGDILSD